MNENFGQSYHDNLDENIQLSKAIAKLEEMVSKEKTEKEKKHTVMHRQTLT